MPSTALSFLKRRIAGLLRPSSISSSISSSSRAIVTITSQHDVDNAQTANFNPNAPRNSHSPKRSKILRNLLLPWKKKPSHKLPAQVPLQQPEDPEAALQDSSQPLQAIHRSQREHQHRILSRRSSGITVGTDCYSPMDTHSESSVPSPRSPVFRYRMLYGPSIENIENMGEAHHPGDEYDHHHLLTSEDEFVKELDKELAQASIHVMKKRNAKQLRLRLSIEGACPGSRSIGSSAPSTPVSVVRCKTSRGTYDASCPSSPTTPTSSRYFLRCKTSRGTYDASGPSTPTTLTSAHSFLSSSLPLKSPGLSHRFSSKVAPSPSAPRHVSPKPPPLSRLTSFSDLQDLQGSIMLTKEHIEHIRRIENRLCVLENSATRVTSSEPEQQLQNHHQPVFDHTSTSTPVREEPIMSRPQQPLRIKPSLTRRVDNSYDFRTRVLQQRRISAIDKSDCQSPTLSSFHDAAVSRSFSFHDWGSRWRYTAATAAAAAVTRSSRHNGEEPPDKTEQLLEQVKERVMSRIGLESALWETEALLRQYETLVVQGWELKPDSLRTNAAATTAVAGKE